MFPIRDHNPSLRPPVITWTLIAINVLVFLSYWPMLGDERAISALFSTFGVVPAAISHGVGYGALITSMFLHGGFLHLAGNMLFLFIFGDNLEDKLGHVGFALFYLACGIGAALMQVAVAPNSMVPMVGASGAIAGVMGGYLLLFPRARVDVLVILVLFVTVVTIPAWLMLGFWFLVQLASGLANPVGGGGIAFWAHTGGFLVGILLVLPTWIRLGGPQFWDRSHGHPEHAEATYRMVRTGVPRVPRK